MSISYLISVSRRDREIKFLIKFLEWLAQIILSNTEPWLGLEGTLKGHQSPLQWAGTTSTPSGTQSSLQADHK